MDVGGNSSSVFAAGIVARVGLGSRNRFQLIGEYYPTKIDSPIIDESFTSAKIVLGYTFGGSFSRFGLGPSGGAGTSASTRGAPLSRFIRLDAKKDEVNVGVTVLSGSKCRISFKLEKGHSVADFQSAFEHAFAADEPELLGAELVDVQ